MPDLSMCNGANCVYKINCYRYRAKPSKYRQAYGAFDSVHHPRETRCEYYYSVATIRHFNLVLDPNTDVILRPRRVRGRVYNHGILNSGRNRRRRINPLEIQGDFLL